VAGDASKLHGIAAECEAERLRCESRRSYPVWDAATPGGAGIAFDGPGRGAI